MLPTSRLFPVVPALLLAGILSAPLLPADTLLLNDGTEVEGKIIEETDTYVTIEVQVSKSIRDTKLIQRTDIKQLSKETPDAILYEEMQGLLPARDRMNVSDYDSLLALYPRRFASEFPSSPLLPKVRALEKKLEEEKALAAAGSVKLDGKWISPKEIAADPYNHEASLLGADVNDLLAAGDFTGALQKFDALESSYPYSKALPPLLPSIIKALDTYEGSLGRALRDNPVKLAEREKQLNSLDPQGREAAEASFARELQAFKTEWEAARTAKLKWLPISTWDKKSLDEASKSIVSEKARLAKIDPAERGRAASLLALCFAALSEKKPEAAELHISQAAEAGIDSKTLAPLRERVTAAKAAAETAAAAEPTPVPTETTETPFVEGTPEPAPPMKKDENETKAEEPKDDTAKPAPTPAPAPEPAKPDKPAPAKASAKAPMTGTARDLSGLVDEEDGQEKAEKEPAIPFKTILFILVGVMVCVTVLAKVFSKPAPEDFEEAASGDDEDDAR